MISLNVEPYCHKCGCFEPETETISAGGVFVDTYIKCTYRERCKVIADYLKRTEFDRNCGRG